MADPELTLCSSPIPEVEAASGARSFSRGAVIFLKTLRLMRPGRPERNSGRSHGWVGGLQWRMFKLFLTARAISCGMCKRIDETEPARFSDGPGMMRTSTSFTTGRVRTRLVRFLLERPV